MTVIQKLQGRRKAAAKGYSDANRALHELREMIARLHSEREEIEARPVPLSEAQDNAAKAVIREAERALDDIHLAGLMRPEGRAPRLDLTDAQRSALAFAASAEGVAAALSARLAERYRKNALQGMESDEKTAALAKIDADALACECAEEQTIREMEQQGAAPLRRADSDPRATLAHDAELK